MKKVLFIFIALISMLAMTSYATLVFYGVEAISSEK